MVNGFTYTLVWIAVLVAFGFLINIDRWWPNLIAKFQGSFIDDARDAAFEVLEVSMLEQPDDWELWPSKSGAKTVGLFNNKAKAAVYIGDGIARVFVINRPEGSTEDLRTDPPFEWRLRLLAAAQQLISIKDERAEAVRLKAMVASFSRLSDVRRKA